MTNYEWLLQMGGEERQAWFDAQHVDGVEIQGELDEIETDSREKLEEDVRNILKSAYMYAWMHGYENRRGSSFEKLHVEFYNLLDRQAAITEREVQKRHELFCETCERVNDEQLAELTAKLENEKKHREYAYKEANKFIEVNGKLVKNVNALTARVDELTAEREEYRELFSQAITHAHEIVNLQP